MATQNIAIIGAGPAGISAAQSLVSAGHSVTLFDKANRAGGRTSTRTMQTELGQLVFDHGAPYFQVSDRGFRQIVEDWEDAGWVEPWQRDISSYDVHGDLLETQSAIDWVAIPKMETLMQALAEPLNVKYMRRVASINMRSRSIELTFEHGEDAQSFDQLICAIPAEQAAVLLKNAHYGFAEKAKGMTSRPCWVTMLSYASPVNFHAAELKVSDGAIVEKAIAQHRKPGRDSHESWLIQSSGQWSEDNLERDKADIAALVSEAFAAQFDLPEPDFKTAHRWRYSQPENAFNDCFLYKGRLGVCGDWLMGGDLEGAWLSGQSLANHMIDNMI